MTDLPSRMARAEQRLNDIEQRVSSILPLVTTVATLLERVQQVREDFVQVREDFADFRSKIDAREEANSRERRSLRLALLAMTITVLCALIAAAATIGSTGGFH